MIRLAPIGDFSACSLQAFVAGTSAPGARVITDGWSGYGGLSDHDHAPKIVGTTSAHLVLEVEPSRVLEPEAAGRSAPSMACAVPICAATCDEFVFR